MKKLSTVLFCMILALYGCEMWNPAFAVTSITPNVKTDACPSTFTRSAANLCLKSVAPSSVGLTLDNTCRSVDGVANYSFPSSTTYAKLAYAINLVSQNSIGTRRIDLNLYTDSSCLNQSSQPGWIAAAREDVAIAGSVPILIVQPIPFDIKLGPSATIYYKGTLTTCSSCSIFLFGVGYYD